MRVRGARTPSLARRALGLAARAGGILVVATVLAVFAYRFVAPPVTPLMALRSVERLLDGQGPWLARSWVDLDEMSPALLRSVIAAEDARFFEHHGIDFDAAARARRYNARQAGRHLRGASTITMQCARNVFLWQGRTYVRKALEVYFGFLLEVLWGKRRILEVYLNVVEWGDGVFGAEAAARRDFGVHAAGLSPRQAALLAAALPNPRRWNPAAPTAYLARRGAIIEGRARHVSLRRLGPGPWQTTRRSPPTTRLTGSSRKESIRPETRRALSRAGGVEKASNEKDPDRDRGRRTRPGAGHPGLRRDHLVPVLRRVRRDDSSHPRDRSDASPRDADARRRRHPGARRSPSSPRLAHAVSRVAGPGCRQPDRIVRVG